jgi:hypothetical protein
MPSAWGTDGLEDRSLDRLSLLPITVVSAHRSVLGFRLSIKQYLSLKDWLSLVDPSIAAVRRWCRSRSLSLVPIALAVV